MLHVLLQIKKLSFNFNGNLINSSTYLECVISDAYKYHSFKKLYQCIIRKRMNYRQL